MAALTELQMDHRPFTEPPMDHQWLPSLNIHPPPSSSVSSASLSSSYSKHGALLWSTLVMPCEACAAVAAAAAHSWMRLKAAAGG